MSSEKLLEKALFELFERALPLHEDELGGEDGYLRQVILSDYEVKGEVLDRTKSAKSFFESILLYKVTVGESYFYCKLEIDSRVGLATCAKLVPKEEVEVDTVLQAFVVDEENLLAQCKVYNSSSTYWAILPNIKDNTTEVDLKEVKHYTLKEAISRLSFNDSLKEIREWGNKPPVPDSKNIYELQESVTPHIYIGTGVCDQRFAVGNPLQDSRYQVR